MFKRKKEKRVCCCAERTPWPGSSRWLQGHVGAVGSRGWDVTSGQTVPDPSWVSPAVWQPCLSCDLDQWRHPSDPGSSGGRSSVSRDPTAVRPWPPSFARCARAARPGQGSPAPGDGWRSDAVLARPCPPGCARPGPCLRCQRGRGQNHSRGSPFPCAQGEPGPGAPPNQAAAEDGKALVCLSSHQR